MSVDTDNPNYDSRNDCNAIIETASNTLISGCKNTVIPNSVTSTGYGAFAGCSNLTSVTIPEGVTSIGWGTFAGCSSLTSITIPESVTSIGDDAFMGCSSLTSITIPEGVTSIGEFAFDGCNGLNYITSKIKNPFRVRFASFSFNYSTPLYVPAGTKEKYLTTEDWNRFTNIIEIDEEITAGDINGDGRISISDVSMLTNYLLGKNPENFNSEAADVNGDGRISISDISKLVNQLLNK